MLIAPRHPGASHRSWSDSDGASAPSGGAAHEAEPPRALRSSPPARFIDIEPDDAEPTRRDAAVAIRADEFDDEGEPTRRDAGVSFDAGDFDDEPPTLVADRSSSGIPFAALIRHRSEPPPPPPPAARFVSAPAVAAALDAPHVLPPPRVLPPPPAPRAPAPPMLRPVAVLPPPPVRMRAPTMSMRDGRPFPPPPPRRLPPPPVRRATVSGVSAWAPPPIDDEPHTVRARLADPFRPVDRTQPLDPSEHDDGARPPALAAPASCVRTGYGPPPPPSLRAGRRPLASSPPMDKADEPPPRSSPQALGSRPRGGAVVYELPVRAASHASSAAMEAQDGGEARELPRRSLEPAPPEAFPPPGDEARPRATQRAYGRPSDPPPLSRGEPARASDAPATGRGAYGPAPEPPPSARGASVSSVPPPAPASMRVAAVVQPPPPDTASPWARTSGDDLPSIVVNPVPAAAMASRLATDPAMRAAPAFEVPQPPRTFFTPAKLGLITAAASLVLSVLLVMTIHLFRQGKVRIELEGAREATIAKAEVYLDGQKVCDTAPCVVDGLSPGAKTVRVIAGGSVSPPVTVQVERGKEMLALVPVPAFEATGELRIASPQPGIRVFVDGVDRGTLPVTLKSISAGTHRLRFEGGERYEPFEQTVEIGAGKVHELGSVRLKLLRGRITVDAPDGARVVLVRNTPPSTQKVLSGPFPVSVDLEAGRWQVIASKRGQGEALEEVSFDDGVAQKSVRIQLAETSAPAVATPTVVDVASLASVEPPAPRSVPMPVRAADVEPEPAPPAQAPSGTGSLNINSLPPSKVLLDGRPLGSTPKVDVRVSAGVHTVTFVHPDLGRKSVSVTVQPGQTATAAVRFRR